MKLLLPQFLPQVIVVNGSDPDFIESFLMLMIFILLFFFFALVSNKRSMRR